MVVLCTQLILCLSLRVLGFSTFLAQRSLDDNEDMVSSADSSEDGEEPMPGGGLGSDKMASRRPSPWQLEQASHQWSRFLGLQKLRDSPRPSATLGFGGSIRTEGSLGDLTTRGGGREGEGLQIQRTMSNEVGETAGGVQMRMGLEDEPILGRWGMPRRTGDDPGLRGSDDTAWASAEGPTEEFNRLRSEVRPGDGGAGPLPGNTDDGERERTAEEAWRRVMERGRGAEEEIILPLTEHELTRSSCRSVPFVQRVSRPWCRPLSVRNQLCFGQCRSFFVPGSGPQIHRSCSRCSPSRLRHATVPLQCQGGRALSVDLVLVEECQCGLEKEPPLEG